MREPGRALTGWDLPAARQTREAVAKLASSNRPIVVGPWLSEIGFELLYWIPFVAWARAYGELDPARLFVVSRGGAASWYASVTTNCEDVLSLYGTDEFLNRNQARMDEQRGQIKHVEITSVDREIVTRVAERHGLEEPALLHPSLMYRLFHHFWYQRAPMTLLEAFTAFSPLPRLELGDLASRLPSRYVAAKFYGNTAFPDSPENRAFVATYLQRLTERSDVVLLSAGARFDDHGDLPIEARERLHGVDHLMTPATNLEVQTRIISGAEAFVGTYGGFSYLAPLSGTDALAFYSDPFGFRFDHLDVAKRVFAAIGGGTFVEMDVRSANLLRLLA